MKNIDLDEVKAIVDQVCLQLAGGTPNISYSFYAAATDFLVNVNNGFMFQRTQALFEAVKNIKKGFAADISPSKLILLAHEHLDNQLNKECNIIDQNISDTIVNQVSMGTCNPQYQEYLWDLEKAGQSFQYDGNTYHIEGL